MPVTYSHRSIFHAPFRSVIALLAICIIQQNSALAEDTDKTKMYELETSKPSGLVLPNDMKKIVFSTRENAITGWLRENGDWYIEGTIQHRSFLCADYRLGVRFGHGNPACVNVDWFNDVQYATRQKQCNNAIYNHSGYESDSQLAEHFQSITCAKVIIKCNGAC